MKKAIKGLITSAFLTVTVSCFGQAVVNLGSVTLSAEQVTGMTWHWQNYTNAMWLASKDTNLVPPVVYAPLTKVQWFVAEGTNLVMSAVNRKVADYGQAQKQALIDVWLTNDTKRAQIISIIGSP